MRNSRVFLLIFGLSGCYSDISEGLGSTDSTDSGASHSPGGTDTGSSAPGTSGGSDTSGGSSGSQGGGGSDSWGDTGSTGSTGTSGDTDGGTDAGTDSEGTGGGGWGDRYYDEEDCAASFGGAHGYELCGTEGWFSWPGEACHFQTDDKRSCHTICEAGGGECKLASDEFTSECNVAKGSPTAEGCHTLTDVDRVCTCVYDPVMP